MTGEELLLARDVLTEQWSVAPPTVADAELNWELLLDALAERIEVLLEDHPRKLLTALYVLDISERRFKEDMTAPTPRARARALAQTILERETQKILTRRQYAGPGRIGIPNASQPEE